MSLFRNVAVVSIAVKDWERAKKFYGEVLEWPVVYADDDLGWVGYGHADETRVAITRWTESTSIPRGGGAMLILAVDDAYAVTKALRAKGVRCDGVVNIPGVVTYGTFYDPEGNCIQFASDQQPPA